MLSNIIERAELDKVDAFNRIHIIYAFTQMQATESIEKISEILATESQIAVVTIQSIEHLFSKPPSISKVTQEFYKKMVYNLVSLCRGTGIPIVASAPLSNHGRPIPVPEGGNSLAQLAEVSLYLRTLRSGGATAYILNHYEKNRIGLRIDLDETELKKTRSSKPWKQAVHL
jgi:16S rRNA C1402 N4-methylase RsmH